jgi:hypothetical protein
MGRKVKVTVVGKPDAETSAALTAAGHDPEKVVVVERKRKRKGSIEVKFPRRGPKALRDGLKLFGVKVR